jgi:hypothetical protein
MEVCIFELLHSIEETVKTHCCRETWQQLNELNKIILWSPNKILDRGKE